MNLHNFEHILFDEKFPVRVIVEQVNHFSLHWHHCTELLYTVKGSITAHVNNETYLLKAGEIILISMDEIHGINRTDEDNLLVALQLDESYFGLDPDLKKYSFDCKSFIRDQANNPDAFVGISNIINRIVWAYNKQPKGFRYQINALIYEILADLIWFDYFTESEVPPSENCYSYQRIYHILEYINDHYQDNLSLKQIADHEHISYFYLSRLFKEITSITFTEYLSSIRVKKTLEALETRKTPLLQIALDNGFPSEKSLNDAFKKHYGVTPGAYRRSQQHNIDATTRQMRYNPGNENDMLYVSMNNAADLAYIYNLVATQPALAANAAIWEEDRHIAADAMKDGIPLVHSWSMTGACSRAADLLRSEVQQQVLQAKERIGYRYLRFHGIFCDDMMVCSKKTDGTVVYNWKLTDCILDFLIGHNIRPFLEMSFTPSAMATDSATLFWYQANVSVPDPRHWATMISGFFRHCVERYGAEEVAAWYAEVWNEPDYANVFWFGSMEDYFTLYRDTVSAIKAILPQIKVGGPAITSVQYGTTRWIREFTLFCRREKLPVDFVSYHIYCDKPANYPKKDGPHFPTMATSDNIEKNQEIAIIQTHKATLDEAGVTVGEIHVSEWNVSAKPRFKIRDTAFMAPYIINGALSSCSQLNSLAFWTITDLMEEVALPADYFHGGLGLMTSGGIPKPSFLALSLLHKLGDVILDQGNGYIITRKNDCYQILTYNLVYLDQLAAKNSYFTGEYTSNPYALFEEKPALHFHFMLKGLSGSFRVTRYEVNRKYGSVYDTWIAAGASKTPNQDELAYLRAAAVPKTTSCVVDTQNGELHLDSFIPLHGCQLLLMNPVLSN